MSGTTPRRTGPDAALAHLRRADPVLAGIIAAHPDFDARAWLAGLPPMDLFGALVFQVAGQQLSVAATRRILERLCAGFDGRLPEPAALLAMDPAALRATGLSGRKIETLRAVAGLFADRGAPPPTRARHRQALTLCLAALDASGAAPLPELAAEELRIAADELGRITGRIDIEDMLDSVFRDFCIGK